jgi:hypothetical protein
MRFLIVLIVGVILGWFVGSLFPAPQAWTSGISGKLHGQHASANGRPQTSLAPAAVATSAPASVSSSPSARPAAKGGLPDQQTLNQYRAWITQARQEHPYPDSEARMYGVMMCESKGEDALVNRGGDSGLFQFSPSLWKGTWNTYRNQSILDPKAQIFAAALAWHNHLQNQWGCYKHAS